MSPAPSATCRKTWTAFLSDFNTSARPNLWKAPRGVKGSESSSCQRHHFRRHHLVASCCDSCKTPQRYHLHLHFLPASRRSERFWTSLAQNLICLAVPTQSICAASSLACPVSLCFARDCRSSVATRCVDPRSRCSLCPPLRQSITSI
jgi:hypothetical protein